MKPDGNFSQYNIAGDRFSLMDGIIGLAHSIQLDLLYYQALASNRFVFLSHLSLFQIDKSV